MQSKQNTTARATAANDQEPKSTVDFDSFELADTLRQAVREAGYETPTPIQQAAIPLLLEGLDLIGCAQTGTGKTAAFALPILHRLMRTDPEQQSRRIRVLVLAPTRELAAQIGESFAQFGKKTSMRTTVVFGGVPKSGQIRALARKPAIVVATPGRLLDLLGDKVLSLADVEYAVLDEGDRMLDMGFIHDVKRIMSNLPAKRQTMLFSATMPREIEGLAAQFLRNPKRVAVDPISSARDPISQSVHFVEKTQKIDLLIRTLSNDGQALVFTRTKHGANKVARQLGNAGISAAAIHGNKSQSARESALAAFKSGRTRIVVATDLASRGIDIKELPLVINYDLPNEPEVYVHRIGRTGRAGAVGSAVSFCSREELPYLGSIERLTRRRIDRVGTAPEGIAPASPPRHAPTREPRHTDVQRRPGRSHQQTGRAAAPSGTSHGRPERSHALHTDSAAPSRNAASHSRSERSHTPHGDSAKPSASASRGRPQQRRDRDNDRRRPRSGSGRSDTRSAGNR